MAATRLEICLLLPRAHCMTLVNLYTLLPESVSLFAHRGVGVLEGAPTLSDQSPKWKEMHSGPTAAQRMAEEAAAASVGRLLRQTSPEGHLPAKVPATPPSGLPHSQTPPGASLGAQPRSPPQTRTCNSRTRSPGLGFHHCDVGWNGNSVPGS